MSSRSLVLTFSFLALQLSLLPAAVTSAAAQGQAQPVSKYRFQALDKNNDGRITREEWDGNSRSFQNHDWNGDGVLSGNEVRPGVQRDTELADHNPSQFERNLNWTKANFASLDHNRDNRLSANEWHFDIETFRRVDANANDSISLQEFLGEGVEDVRDDSFDNMDWNNNGRVERSEWYGGAAEFTRLDRNRDGVLTRYDCHLVGTRAAPGHPCAPVRMQADLLPLCAAWSRAAPCADGNRHHADIVHEGCDREPRGSAPGVSGGGQRRGPAPGLCARRVECLPRPAGCWRTGRAA